MFGDREQEPALGVAPARMVVDASKHEQELRRAMQTGQDVPRGRLFGLPELPGGDVWVDIAGAAVVTRCATKTITSWLARCGPVRHPFPAPHRFLYRLYWPFSAVEAWRTEEDRRRGAESADPAR